MPAVKASSCKTTCKAEKSHDLRRSSAVGSQRLLHWNRDRLQTCSRYSKRRRCHVLVQSLLPVSSPSRGILFRVGISHPDSLDHLPAAHWKFQYFRNASSANGNETRQFRHRMGADAIRIDRAFSFRNGLFRRKTFPVRNYRSLPGSEEAFRKYSNFQAKRSCLCSALLPDF